MSEQQTNKPPPSGQAPRKTHLIHASRLDELPSVEYLDEAKRYPQRGLVVYFGHPGTTKTFLLLADLHLIAQEHVVIFVPSEGLYGLHNRLVLTLCDYRGLDVGNFYVYDKPVQVAKKSERDAFIADIRQQQLAPAVVAFDTLSGNFVGFDETADMGLFVAGCSEVARTFDGLVVASHHEPRKGGHARGGGVLDGACEAMFQVQRKGSLVKVINTKPPKEAERIPVETYRIVKHLDSLVLACDGAPSNKELALLKVIAAQPGITAVEIIPLVTVSKATVYRELEKLIDKTLILSSDGALRVSPQGLKIPGVSPISRSEKSVRQQKPSREPGDSGTQSHAVRAALKPGKSRADNKLAESLSQVSRSKNQSAETETPANSLTVSHPYSDRGDGDD